MTSNIERFDYIVVQALAELYGCFPVRTSLLANRFILSDDGQPIEALSPADEMSLGEREPNHLYFVQKEFAFEALLWLVEAGYVRGEPKGGAYIIDAVLTAKGLEVLKATPDSLQESLGERMQEAAKSGMGEAARVLIGQVVSLGVGLVT